MKVLQYSTWNEHCGIAAYTANLVKALGDLGVEADVHPVNSRERKYAVRAEVARDLDAFCARARDFDLVHIQHEFSFFDRFDLRQSVRQFARVLRTLRGQNTPVVVTFHTLPPFRAALVDVIDQYRGGLSRHVRGALLVRSALLARRWRRSIGGFFRTNHRRSHALVHTKTTRRLLVQEGKFLESAITVMPVGVVGRRPTLGTMSREAAKSRIGYPRDAVLLSIFGFVQHFKGYETALRALAALPAPYHLAIVGGPHPERGSLDRTVDVILDMTERLELGDRVRITGFVDFDTLDLYHAATDACIAPYHRGDLISGSAAITWALSSGRPVIASSIPAFVELQEEAACLALFAQNAPHELAWQIERVLTDADLERALVERAAAYTRSHEWSCVARQILSVYERIAARD